MRQFAKIMSRLRGRFQDLSRYRWWFHPRDRAIAQAALGNNIECVEIPIDDGWFRDNGPNFLVNDQGDVAAACFGFNAWGDNYEPFADDAQAGARLLSHLGLCRFQSEMIAEGGGITVDGQGTLITTETCFLNPNRNPGWSKGEVERELARMLGVTKIILDSRRPAGG